MNRMNNLGLDSIKEDGQTRAHKAAAKGDINAIETIYNAEPHLINHPDSNNWLPIHEVSSLLKKKNHVYWFYFYFIFKF